MEKKGIEEIFEKYRYESGTLDLAIEDQLPMIKEIQAELDRAREEGRKNTLEEIKESMESYLEDDTTTYEMVEILLTELKTKEDGK